MDSVQTRMSTGFIYYPNEEHVNKWNKNFPECPERAEEIYKRLSELELITKCSTIAPDHSIDITRLIEKVHSKEMIEKISELCKENSKKQAEIAYDSVYYNGIVSVENARHAALCCVSLASKVAKGELKNGFAAIRPPGHHASYEPNGYCIFNNVAICAEHLISSGMAEKVLIIDFDVHHGQGTQRCFYDRNDVLYFSIHRYEHGTYWPNLKESDSSYIGQGNGRGFNVNVPLNEMGLGDTEYIAIILNILLPLAYEYNPDIILVSAGYDSCMGCPKGEMKVTPAFYGHLITFLGGIADGKIVCLLEGGYYRPSLAEGAAMTLKALLGFPCTPLEIKKIVIPSVIDSINDVRYHHREKWSWCCVELSESIPFQGLFNAFEEHTVIQRYHGEEPKPPFYMNDKSMARRSNEKIIEEELEYFKSIYHKSGPGVLWLSNEILEKKLDHDLISKVQKLDPATTAVGLVEKMNKYNLNFGFSLSPLLGDTLLLTVNDLRSTQNVKKVLIIDFNNNDQIQKLTYERNDVLYVRIGDTTSDVNYKFIGKGKGYGYNVIFPNKRQESCSSYDLFSWILLVLPLAYSYGPDITILKFSDKFNVSVEILGHLINLLKSVSKVLIMIEEKVGDEKEVILYVEACLKALFGELLPKLIEYSDVNCIKYLSNIIDVHKVNWPMLQVNKRILNKVYTEDQIHDLMISST